jgi:hypothetical protein
MPMTRFQKDTGTIIKPGPMITAEPDMIVTDEQVESVMVLEDGNPAYVADTIVSFVVHERLGLQLYKVLGGLSNNPVLQAHFARILADAEQAVEVYEQLQEHLGIPLTYISPAGRMTEGMDQHLIASFLAAGSADPMTLEMAAVNATLTAASLCVANVELLSVIADGMTDEKAVAAVRNAVSELDGPANEHLEWAKNARRAMARVLGRSKSAEKAGNLAEEMYGKVKAAVS